MRQLFLLIIGLFLFSNTSISAQKIKWLEGVWTGVGYQIDGGLWMVELIHDTAEKSFDVTYPSLGCKGEWVIQEKSKGKVIFQENIEKGHCDKGVRIVVTQIDEKFVSVAFFLDSYGESPIAYTVLEKERAVDSYIIPGSGT